MVYVTTSWDDGDVLDIRLAQLLTRYGAKGTFYITKQYREKRLSDEEIKTLSQTHEIGAHTLTHPNLTRISREEALKEIRGSKEWLESVLGKEAPLFCYPAGHYNESVESLVKEAGFKGARTTAHSHTEMPTNSYEVPTTLHVYPFPFRKKLSGGYYWSVLLEPFVQRYGWYRALGVSPFAMTSWLSAAKAAFDHAYKSGEVFHVWGHSWELESYGMWEDFEELLKYIAGHVDVQFVTNSELLAKK